MDEPETGRGTGYCGPQGSPAFARVLYLGTPLYSEPDRGAPKLAYLQQGTRVEVLGRKGGFLHVRTEQGGEGYLREEAVSDVAPRGQRAD
jgi:hypothetical protein